MASYKGSIVLTFDVLAGPSKRLTESQLDAFRHAVLTLSQCPHYKWAHAEDKPVKWELHAPLKTEAPDESGYRLTLFLSSNDALVQTGAISGLEARAADLAQAAGMFFPDTDAFLTAGSCVHLQGISGGGNLITRAN